MSLALLLGPAILLAAALVLRLRSVPRGDLLLRAPEWSALAALGLAALSALALALGGPATSPLLGAGGVGLSARTDIVSVSLTLTVAFVGWVVLRFSRIQLDGEPAQARFMSGLSATLACVVLVVSAGNVVQLAVAWTCVGIGLRGLILFRPDRPRARRAARKKLASSVLGSLALVLALAVLWRGYGTTDIAALSLAARAGVVPDGLWIAAAGLALAAILKSALIPAHGWLTEVMEAPTPVSALLHAGVVNAGGFLLIRFADVLLLAPGVLAVLALIGGFSALAGAAVALTQPSVKTALAWSTCAQMGFMVLQCGLALFPLALLHIVAHSLYKAHAFLASGGAVRQVASIRRPGPVAAPSVGAVVRAFAIALAVYLAVWLLFGLVVKSAQAAALGMILIFGTAYLIAQGLAGAAPRALAWRVVAISFAATVGYFVFQSAATALAAGTLPAPPAPDGLVWAVMVLAVGSFAIAAFAQATFPLWAGHPAAAGLRVHLLNGLYLSALTDRLLGRRAPGSAA